MPTIRKLQDDEVRRSRQGESTRAIVAREYDRSMDDFSPNEYGEAIVDEEAGEKKLTIRNRLKAAAERRGWTLEFLRTPGAAIRFHIQASDATAANGGSGNAQEEEQFRQLEQPDAPEPRARRGRNKQSAQQEQAVGGEQAVA
jgi:hypothetical protein